MAIQKVSTDLRLNLDVILEGYRQAEAPVPAKSFAQTVDLLAGSIDEIAETVNAIVDHLEQQEGGSA